MPVGYPGWPYATKAVIQHEWQTDHLNVWVTFADAMDVAVKPPTTLWLLKADAVLRAIFLSAWQDPWTLLLTTVDFDGPPARVLLAFDGPSQDLRLTAAKQWEPWGPILSLDVTS